MEIPEGMSKGLPDDIDRNVICWFDGAAARSDILRSRWTTEPRMRKLPSSFADLREQSLNTSRWPQDGDRVLRRQDSGGGVAFAQTPVSRHVFLWDGYMKAGAGLVELCTQDGYQHHGNDVVYPILFNYRHGIELALKWIIEIYGGGGAPKGHDLLMLWHRCRKIVERYPDGDFSALNAVESIIEEFHELDSKGQSFRYSRDTKEQFVQLPDGRIDLTNIRDVMEGVENYFRGLDGWLDAMQSAAPSSY